MANDLRFISTLDHSDFDKGISESTAEIRKLAEDTNQAQKGIKGMFDVPEIRQAREQFAGVDAAIKKFTSAMSRELPMKMELRRTQEAAQELERAYRALSDEQRNTASGQALKRSIDQLIQKGGQLRDTMADVQRAMKFKASDTATFDAVAMGIRTATSAAQVATGVFALFGASEQEVAKIQKDLIALMSIANGLKTIQNALQKESALMLGLEAARTATLNAVTSARIALTNALTVSTTKLATAMGLSAAATKALRIALAGLAIGAVIALVTALAKSLNDTTSAAKKAEEEQKRINEVTAKGAAVYVQEIATLAAYRKEVENFNGTARQESILVDELNTKYGDALGKHAKLAEWKSVLIQKGAAYAKQLMQEAMAQAALTKYVDAYMTVMEAQRNVQKAMMDAARAGTLDKLFNGGQYRIAIVAARNEMAKAEEEAKSYLRMFNSAFSASWDTRRAADLGTPKETKQPKSSKTTKTETKKEQAPEGSAAWYDEQIKRLQTLADKATNADERMRLLGEAMAYSGIKAAKYPESIETASEKVQRLKDDLKLLSEQTQKSIEKIDLSPIGERLQKQMDKIRENMESFTQSVAQIQSGIRSMGQIVGNVGKIMGGAAGDWLSWAANVISAISAALPEIAKLLPALFSKAAAETMAQNASMGPFGWVSGIAAMASILAAMASLPKFATGGIVGGTSYTGDKQLVRVNSGEMILNGQQQANLWNAVNSSGYAGGQVTFRIEGQQLVGVLNNYNSKYSRLR